MHTVTVHCIVVVVKEIFLGREGGRCARTSFAYAPSTDSHPDDDDQDDIHMGFGHERVDQDQHKLTIFFAIYVYKCSENKWDFDLNLKNYVFVLNQHDGCVENYI